MRMLEEKARRTAAKVSSRPTQFLSAERGILNAFFRALSGFCARVAQMRNQYTPQTPDKTNGGHACDERQNSNDIRN
ncbi:MAG: hypothetical protein ABF868_05010 [Sporolactobacillus sp.]